MQAFDSCFLVKETISDIDLQSKLEETTATFTKLREGVKVVQSEIDDNRENIAKLHSKLDETTVTLTKLREGVKVIQSEIDENRENIAKLWVRFHNMVYKPKRNNSWKEISSD